MEEIQVYNAVVVAYNVVTLRDAMEQFVTLESPRFQLRMDAREAEIAKSDMATYDEFFVKAVRSENG